MQIGVNGSNEPNLNFTKRKFQRLFDVFVCEKIKNETTCPELNLSSVVHLQHKYCNAQWLHMENPSDETNAFSVHFKTVPQNSTGNAYNLYISILIT